MKAILALGLLMVAAGPSLGQPIEFGDDSGSYTRDGECDDRRFFGAGMSEALDWEEMGRDATDCRAAFDAGRIRLWNFAESRAATNCAVIDFGDNSGDYPNDGECDDPRFEGLAVDGILTSDDIGKDANDCRRACTFGLLGLRAYDDVTPPTQGGGKKSN